MLTPTASRWTLAWAAAACLTSPATAQTSPPLSLSDALHAAMKISPQLQSAQLELQASDGARQQAAAHLNPEIQLLREDTRQSSSTTTYQLSQTIEIAGKRASRMAVAASAYRQAQATQADRIAQLQWGVTQAYLDLAAARERRRLEVEALTAAEQLSEAARKRVKAGKASPLEESKALIAQAHAQQAARQAAVDERIARRHFEKLTGMTVSDTLELAWPTPQATDQGRCEENSPEITSSATIQAAITERDRLASQADLERARQIPDPTVVIGIKRAQELSRDQLVLGINLPLPVWDRNQGNLLQALRLADKAATDLLTARQQLSQQCSELSFRHAAAAEELQTLTDLVIPQAIDAWHRSITAFENGKATFMEMQDAQRALLTAQDKRLTTRVSLHRYAAELTRVMSPIDTDDRQP